MIAKLKAGLTELKQLEGENLSALDDNKLEEYLKLVEITNAGAEFTPDEAIEKIRDIAKHWHVVIDGSEQPLISDDELHHLSINKGTITQEERSIINNHIVVTIKMLESLPFPKHLKCVPEYAGGHH